MNSSFRVKLFFFFNLITGVGAGLQLDGEELRGLGPFHDGAPQGALETTLVSTLSGVYIMPNIMD